MSRPSEPVETTDRSLCTRASPIFMIEPLPNCFSICAKAALSALLLLSSIAFIPLDLAKPALLMEAPIDVRSKQGHYGIERSFDTTPTRLRPYGRSSPATRWRPTPAALHFDRRR